VLCTVGVNITRGTVCSVPVQPCCTAARCTALYRGTSTRTTDTVYKRLAAPGTDCVGRAREAVPVVPEVPSIARADLRSWFRDGVFRTALTRGLVRGVFVRVNRTFVTSLVLPDCSHPTDTSHDVILRPLRSLGAGSTTLILGPDIITRGTPAPEKHLLVFLLAVVLCYYRAAGERQIWGEEGYSGEWEGCALLLSSSWRTASLGRGGLFGGVGGLCSVTIEQLENGKSGEGRVIRGSGRVVLYTAL